MDDQLKKDIAEEFHSEYYLAEKGKRTGFLKKLDDLNDKADAFFSKYGLSAGGVELLSSVALLAIVPPVGVLALTAWVGNVGTQIYTSLKDHAAATKAVEADIDNGTLPARYQDVLDDRIKGLQGKIELYTEQKTQLPAKGTAVEAFAAASTGADNDNAPAATPAAKPEAAPKL